MWGLSISWDAFSSHSSTFLLASSLIPFYPQVPRQNGTLHIRTPQHHLLSPTDKTKQASTALHQASTLTRMMSLISSNTCTRNCCTGYPLLHSKTCNRNLRLYAPRNLSRTIRKIMGRELFPSSWLQRQMTLIWGRRYWGSRLLKISQPRF